MLVTITGPSGVGKTTIMRRLIKVNRSRMPLKSTTTRKPRSSDVEGEYEYITEKLFRMIERMNRFLWTVNVHGNCYGTREAIVRTALVPRFQIIAPIVHSAVIKLHAFAQEHNATDQLRSVYILSPGPEILRERLEGREKHPRTNDINRRIEECLPWDEEAQNSAVPYHFLQDNNDLDLKTKLVGSLFN